jgi:hypothetical protein
MLALMMLAMAGSAARAAVPGPWRNGRPEQLNARPGRGRTLKSYPSPDGRSQLLYRDEKEEGDFVWRRVYMKQGNRYTFVGSYQEIAGVHWSDDGKSVRYRAARATGPDTMEHLEVEYRPAARTLRWRVLRVEKLPAPPAG